ncbi:hypothetical protein Tco_1034486, partial [Tanacetum coccineum]
NGDRDVPYDDNSDNASSQSEGSNHSHPSSPTFDHNRDDLRHLYGSNRSTRENEMAVTSDE